MAVNINATGSSHPSFKIGTTGPTIYQGTNPGSVENGDIWIDSVSGAVKVYQGGTFEIFRFGNIAINGNTISSTTGDIVFAPTGNARLNNEYIVTSATPGETLSSHEHESLHFSSSAKITATGAGVTISGVVNATSDENLKENIITYDGKKAAGIRAVDFNWKDKSISSNITTGYIAQEVEKILPEAVCEDSGGIKSVNYDMIHTAKIAELEDRVAQLTNIIKTLMENK